MYKKEEYAGPCDEITFNDVLVKEIFSIKSKLNEILIDKDDWYKESEFKDKIDKKAFLKRYYAYSDYDNIVYEGFYKTPHGKDGAIIIFKQKNPEKDFRFRFRFNFDPLNSLIDKCIGKEILIQLHSAGPKSYTSINQLKVEDELIADVYDPELGYCKNPGVKVISIDNKSGSYRTQEVMVEISSDYFSDTSKKVQRMINLPIRFDSEDRFS